MRSSALRKRTAWISNSGRTTLMVLAPPQRANTGRPVARKRDLAHALFDIPMRYGRTYATLGCRVSWFQEFSPVPRRLTTSLVLWLGLLGLGAPAFACATAAAPDGDCCPQETPSPPCADREVDYATALATACCPAGPVTSPAVSVSAGSNERDQKVDSRSPESLALPAWYDLSPTVRPPEPAPQPAFALRADAALTYLRTGRLRL